MYRRASYTNLEGGDCVFRLKGANSDGVWNEDERMLWVRVVPPFWGTWWFRGLAPGGLLALVLGEGLTWHRRRLRSVERQREDPIEMQRRLADEREAERLHMARELHDVVVQDLYAARFQLETIAVGGLAGEDRRRVDGVQDTLRRVLGTLRAMCKDLRPPLLGSFGLAKAIRSHAARVQEAHPDEGPDLHVVLSSTPASMVEGDTAMPEGTALVIGPLTALSGAQTYELPEEIDLSSFQSVLIHCIQYSHLYGAAPRGRSMTTALASRCTSRT